MNFIKINKNKKINPHQMTITVALRNMTELKEFLTECEDFNINIDEGAKQTLKHNFRYLRYIYESFNGYEVALIWNDSLQAYILWKYKRLPFNQTNTDRYYTSWEK